MHKINTLIASIFSFIILTGPPVFADSKGSSDIHYEGRLSLGETLKDVANKTGIKFFLPGDVAQQSIKAHVHAKNWKSAVHQLLEGYSTLEFWADDLASSKVWVYEKEGSEPSEKVKINSRKAPRSVSTTPPVVRPQTISRPQSVANVPSSNDNPLSLLPRHIRHDPEVLRFLYSKGVDLPKDIKERYGERLENLPPVRPMFPHVAKNPAFVRFLKSRGLQPPRS